MPVSQKAQENTKNILRFFDESMLSNGWIFYGKTGTDVDRKTLDRKGYFVGFATKDKKIISFVIHISGDKNSKVGGIYAKKIALDRIFKDVLND